MKSKPLFEDIQIDLEEESAGTWEDLGRAAEAPKKDVAIIGIAGKLADAHNVGEFWRNLALGKDSIRRIPLSRKHDYEELLSAFLQKEVRKEQSEYAESGYLEQVDRFDCEYFSISRKEAKLMDPNQRLVLQSCVAAMEDAGYGKARLRGTQTGVFLGYSSDFGGEYKHFLAGENAELADLAMTGNIKSIMAARLAYLLDLHGPSMLVDTACSSSLVAVHLACQSIRRGECEQAFAGGVKIQFQPFEKTQTGIGIVSPTFRARTFDSEADGTSLGEGVGIILLKDAAKAIRDGDHIYALIKGSAINQDGQSLGITAPNSRAQEDLIVRAWQDAGIHPETISLIEAHGTATRLGDPVEIEGIKRAFDRYTTKKQFCAIGSVKTNIGHLDHAAGISGLLKCILALKHEIMPPTLHFHSPNKEIDFVDAPVFVNDTARPWEQAEHPKRCGINSFGLSGTNCHLILEQYQQAEMASLENRGEGEWHLLALSAKTPAVLDQLVSAYYQAVNQSGQLDLASLCYTANVGRDHFAHRLAIVFNDRTDLLQKLQAVRKAGVEKLAVKHVFYSGTPREDASHASQGGKDNARLHELLRLALQYAAGETVAWKELYADQRHLAISLPTYPFQDIRCWIEPKDLEKKFAPLVDKRLVGSNGIDIYETRFAVETHWVLAEHKIAGHCVLPGTAYLEMMSEIVRKNMPQQAALVLENVMFLQPLEVKEQEPKSVHIILQKQKSSLDVMVTSPSEHSDDWIVHCRAKVLLQPELPKQKQLSLSELLSEANRQSVSGYKPDADAPVQTGPHWECMKEIYLEQDKIVAFFELPAPFTSELHAHVLHPSLLDCAVNIPISQIRDGLFLPFAYKKIVFAGPMPGRFYSVLQRTDKETADRQEAISFDILLVTEKGEVFAEIHDYTLKRVPMEAAPSAVFSPKGLFHQIVWEAMPLLAENRQPDTAQPLTLVFGGHEPVTQQLIAELKKNGTPAIVATPGKQFAKLAHDQYELSVDQQAFDALWEDIGNKGVQRIVHGFSLSDAAEERASDEGLFSLFHLAKSLVAQNVRQPIDLVLLGELALPVTQTEPAVQLQPMHNALYHLGKVVSSEWSHLRCRCIDLDAATAIPDILAELEHQPDSYIAAYRNGQRYGQKMVELDRQLPTGQTLNLTESGCYVITGGTGGLGLTMARHLAEKQPVHLVLISRSGFPAEDEWTDILQKGEQQEIIRRIEMLQQITASGSTYTIYKADVASKEQLARALEEVRAAHGSINGVIHAAGVAGDQFLFNREEERFREVLQAKTAGSLNVAQLITEPLEFFVCFSSVATLEGTPGQGDYVAANAFLDSFVYSLPAQQNGMTLNWAPWAEIGMAYDYGTFQKELIFHLLTPQVAVAAFDAALALGEKQVVIGKINKEVARKHFRSNFFYAGNRLLIDYVDGAAAAPGESQPVQPATGVFHGDPQHASLQEIKALIRQLWSTLLESDSIQLDDNFTSLGGNSIFAVYLLQELEKYFPDQLGISDIFTYPTINKMAEYVHSRMKKEQPSSSGSVSQEEEDQNLDQILQRLANGELDVEEIDRLLGEEE
ncbi:SDR family NAD(P)-dependent oxidoreductase [Brevibacillus sp. HD3.3A]|uniref:type I polyketide synthase n=1 Tax=Brevibacillus sp. HD3.3A TaxID=2738979 RepID=UPI00156B8867|nr:SDR family NAD(P)-dependent oxidoreductase [Brevibacillus sp. HD3.3A]UED66657.1 SDR family NAD(P)-dependent oxidoreductase [Brevibacillus sp. HD3.3A]